MFEIGKWRLTNKKQNNGVTSSFLAEQTEIEAMTFSFET
jgi:hypothetical protein